MNIVTIKLISTREKPTSNSLKEEIVYTVECPDEFIEMYGKEKALDETCKRCLEFVALNLSELEPEELEEKEDKDKT